MEVTGSLSGTAAFGIVDIGFNQPSIALGGTVALGLYSPVLLSTLLNNSATLTNYFSPAPRPAPRR